ncbi:hypothetical protein RJ639_009668 [Escallonia herrerae]|uniref:BRCT domain-containing protein n=1 Tax=Escallonia herrerae TaxID=1293975 RepID=A0AA88VSM7_9ASTE|nr:hypothetical protein RJ639_009668 [Escallonia herrerae]
MESIVATVSGYHGSQRFKLIKLLSQAGASYVGTLNQSTTHLVCWKFEGKKYEIARKSKTVIVNHRWVEDCIKRGRRVREHPYTQLCGQEVGPLLLDIPLVEKASLLPQNQLQACDNSKNPVIYVDSGDTDCATWTVSNLLKENLFPELGRNDISYRRSKKKILRRRVKQDHLSNSRYLHDEPSEPEELGSSPYTRLRRQKRTPSTSAEASCKGRRLVRKNTSRNFLASLSDSEQECHPRQNCHPTHDITATSSSSSGGRTLCVGRNTGASTDRFSDHMATTNEALKDGDNIKHLHNALAPQDHCSAVDEGLNGTEHISRLSTSTELSCISVQPGGFCHVDIDFVFHASRAGPITWYTFSAQLMIYISHFYTLWKEKTRALAVTARRKMSACPLCKATFVSITKVDDAVSSDQKIYSQTIAHDPSMKDVYILPDGNSPILWAQQVSVAQVCCQCCCREPEDLLIRCQLCQIRCVHSYCLDPPMDPWTCIHCKDLQMLFLWTFDALPHEPMILHPKQNSLRPALMFSTNLLAHHPSKIDDPKSHRLTCLLEPRNHQSGVFCNARKGKLSYSLEGAHEPNFNV